MLSGGKPSGCSTCWKVEAMQGDHLSDRFYRSSEQWAQEGWNDVLAKGADGDIEPRYLEVNFNHACNLACSYCSPHLSSKWAEDIERNGPYPTKVPHNSIEYFKETGKHLEAKRLKSRVEYDLEMMRELGYCSGIENYSRYFDRRKPGTRPFCLLDYFPKDFMMVIDESHVTIPQIRAMYGGDRARKVNLVDYGFRLQAAIDNRLLSSNTS